ncbi:hypothetical protein [Treponema pedis]|uniref:hypothetical protein n=2 Tax=Treponema pedis TaxID=409322 RepID=UPI0004260B66|nr:hypothetical protein [Treponema pedis]
MKKIFFILLVQTVLFTACKLSLNENVGEVVLNFGESGRAIGSDGLPVFGTVPVEIKVYNTETEDLILTKRVENAGENIMFQVPTGITIKIRVYLITPSGSWQGEAVHAVISGTNNVPIKLNKKIADLHGLLFTQTKNANNTYKLTFTLETKTVTAPDSILEKHVFNRDNRGRMYVAYKDTPDWKLQRYTAEGEEDGSAFELKDNSSPPQSVTPSVIMSDFTSGETYLVDTSGKVYVIEDSSLSVLSSTTLSHFKNVAAIDNGQIVYLWEDMPGEPKIYVGSNNRDIKDDIKIGNLPDGKVTDIFIRGNYAYVLFNAFNEKIENDNKRLYSLGGVLRYNINNLGEPPLKIGFNAAPDFVNGVLNNYGYGNYFYGAVKVVGFDEDGLYIADDGFAAAYINEKARIIKNRNRIAYLGFNANALIFAETAVTWFDEYEEWRAPNTKALLWEKSTASGVTDGFDYTIDSLNINSTNQNEFKDIFCFDQDGNLYVVKFEYSTNTWKVFQYKMNVDGTYGTSLISANLTTTGVGNNLSAIAVDVSGANEDIKNYLYYAFKDSKYKIKRLKWDDAFSTAGDDSGFIPITFDPDEEVTALAANRDGLFVAVTKKESDNYTIKVRKYKHGGTQISSECEVAKGQDSQGVDNPVFENIHAMQIVDGTLYAAGYKTVGAGSSLLGTNGNQSKATVSGKLYSLGNSAGSLVLSVLWETGAYDETEDYAPYRFIAVKPEELVIASDGFYGSGTTITQKNKVLTFDLNGNLKTEKEETVEFSRKLEHGGGEGFIWY